ncbi:hypothetical protein [Brevundimonas sp. Root1423]|uniref:hypothetical protein n=1 Tax=Brevundimonas sp. Root1423 TaxID=1736462 RepID=UPI0006F95086|nr:hypothetical protein [Brevundimonas sp. Root1423]KQY75281.1 hypothetical protein ASD25_12085 [Brevundimonas sp. Root1423]
MLELLFAAALIATPAVQDEEPPCEAYGNDDSLSIGAAIAPGRPGGELSLHANEALHGMVAVPLKCFSRWTSSDPAVTIDTERRRIVIAPEATPGRDVEITGTIRDRTVRTRFRIAPADGPVLTGFWSQTSVDCHGPVPRDPLRELRFNSDGKFAVTFVPFEVRQDYWGAVEFDPAAGRIGFSVDRGNTVPADLMLKGTVRVEGDNQLLIDGVYFGGLDVPPPVEGCSYAFRKR